MPAALPPVVAAFDDAQRRSITMLGDIFARLETGMTRRDIEELAETRLGDYQFSGWYHPPEAAIGDKIAKQSPIRMPGAGKTLAVGDLVSIDIGPGTAEAYGDIGATRLFGGGEEPMVLVQAREALRASCGYASRWKTCGEIFIFAQAYAVNHRLLLVNESAVGHRVLTREGMLARGFPRSAHLATLLPRNRLHKLNPVRMDGMFAVRPVLADGPWAAAFEEMLYIHEDVRVVLGRDSLADIGNLPS
jgi:methionine aminopeptidase